MSSPGTPNTVKFMIGRHLLPHARPHWRGIAVSGVSLVAAIVLGLLKPWPLKFLFDSVLAPTGSPRSQDDITRWLVIIGGGIIFLAAGEGLFNYVNNYFLKASAQRIALSLRVALFSHVQRLSLTTHNRMRTGDLITRVTRDVDKVQDVVTEDLMSTIGALLTLIGMGAIMVWIDWQLALVVLSVAPFLFMLVVRYRNRIYIESKLLRRKEGDIASLAEQTLTSIKLVQAYGRERHVSEKFQGQTEEALDAGLNLARLEGRFGWLLGVATATGTAMLVVVGAQRVLAGSLTPGELLVFVSYVKDFYSPMRTLSRLATKFSQTMVRLEQISEVLSEEPGVQEDPEALPAPRLRGRLQFDGVTFRYEEGQHVLDDVTFAAEPGQTVALIGLTGVGKSTLVSMVPRLYDPSEGRVLIDGHDIRRFTLTSLRDQIALVLQETLLFATTVRENIAYGRPDATDREIETAARDADAHDFIMGLPEGYDTVLGEKGNTLSGGQRQRIAIARALVRDVPLLILDEPTTGLDARSEMEVMSALTRLMEGRTTLLITHKLSLVQRADVIVVLENGRVAEKGCHDELLSSGGLYARLLALQAGQEENAPLKVVGIEPAPRAQASPVHLRLVDSE